MDSKLINPFIESTRKVLTSMAQTEVTPGKPYLKQGHATWGDVTGVIKMVSPQVQGTMVLSFDAPSILAIVQKMLSEEFSQINNDVADAVGELTNIITATTKASLSEQGYAFQMNTPAVVLGKNQDLPQQSDTAVIVIPFSTAAGNFVIEANLSAMKRCNHSP